MSEVAKRALGPWRAVIGVTCFGVAVFLDWPKELGVFLHGIHLDDSFIKSGAPDEPGIYQVSITGEVFGEFDGVDEAALSLDQVERVYSWPDCYLRGASWT